MMPRTLQNNSGTVSVIFLLICGAIYVDGSNSGRPLCRTPEDFNRGWSAKNNPKQFWQCTGFGTAELRNCDEGLEFSERYWMCTFPGAILGDIDHAPLIQCDADQVIDLNSEPYCTTVPCADGLIVYNPEGHPMCFRSTTNHIQLCPGAPESKRVGGTASCTRPKCTLAEYQSNRMFPSADPTEFYRCAQVNHLVSFKCTPGLCYDAASQACVWPLTWTNACA